MPELSLEKLTPAVSKRIGPFMDAILREYKDKIHSIHITGTAVTEDFHEGRSDVNSIIVLKEMNPKFLELLAALGKRYGKHKVAAPLIMTPGFIRTSLDVFPIEFLNFKLIHSTVYGEDIFKELEISRADLRQQCERELKVKTMALGQGYISSLGDRKTLTEGLARSITGYIPLFRGIIYLLGKEPPVRHHDVIKALSESSHLNTDVLGNLLKIKHEKAKLSIEELNTIFENYYAVTEKLGEIVNAIKV